VLRYRLHDPGDAMKKLLSILLFVPAMAQAEFWSGNDLHNRLSSSDSGDRIHAMGYIMGVFDAGVNAVFCPPNQTGITAGQIRDMTFAYLSQNPSIRHRTADVIIFDMFKQVWPCTQRGGRGA
jgi:hypothetical protein